MAPTSIAQRDGRYRQAALAYGLLGLAVVLVVSLDPALAVAERRDDLIRLFVGAGFVIVFACAIAWGHLAIGRTARRWLVRVLSLLQIARMLVFAANASGFRPRLRGGFALEPSSPRPKFWIAALLMGIIAALLVRASWMRDTHGRS